jgi:membrane-anchored protein YejM (alkaline phosphatase superfamily)
MKTRTFCVAFFAFALVIAIPSKVWSLPSKANTIVVICSDHGDHLSEKLYWAKRILWEKGTHALLMFRVPEVTKQQQVKVITNKIIKR